MRVWPGNRAGAVIDKNAGLGYFLVLAFVFAD